MVDKIFTTLQQRYPVISALPAYNGKWSYDYGVVLMAVRRLYEQTGEKQYLDYLEANLSGFIHEDGSIYDCNPENFNIDNVNCGKLLFTLYKATGEERYRKAMDVLYGQLQRHPRIKEGAFWHKKIYPWQVWLDGLYMGAPFYTEYLLTFKEGEGLDDIVRQFTIAYERTLDEKTGLLYHAYDEAREQEWADKETGRAPHVWGRAMGWYMMALIDTIELLPEGYAGRETLIGLFIKVAEAIRSVQQPEGVWFQVLDCPGRRGNYLEASCSSMFTAAMLRGVQLGVLDADEWLPTARKAWDGIAEQFVFTTKEGWINLCRTCAVAGLGGADKRDGSFVYYISEPIITNDMKGYGAFFQAAVAAQQLEI